MYRRGNCWDNAPQESFFGHLKDSIKSKNFNSYEELKSEINRYIIYYNNYRYKWNQKRMIPVQYRIKWTLYSRHSKKEYLSI